MKWHTWLAVAFVIAMIWGCKVEQEGKAHYVGQGIRNTIHNVTGH